MKYTIISGEYQTSLDRHSPSQAAKDAISLWQHKRKKPNLATLITVVDPQEKKTYLSTTALMENL